jgi:hypothetical protein
MCTELLPPGGYPTAFNKCIVSYQVIKSTAKKITSIILKTVDRCTEYQYTVSGAVICDVFQQKWAQ